jgi:hypothetical protein
MKISKKLLVVSILLILPSIAFANLSTLNGQSGNTQTFINDTNVGIISSGNTHTLGWSGLLSASRGGTGVDISSFPSNAVLFNNSGIVGGDSSFTFDKTISTLIAVNAQFEAIFDNQVVPVRNIEVNSRVLYDESGDDSVLWGTRTLNDSSGDAILNWGTANSIKLINGGGNGILDISSFSGDDKTFTFPNATGTFSLLESTQDFSGVNTFSNPVNNFISSTDSTVHIGADGFPGCIAMGDSDSSGVTYITANNGVLSASSTPPANCN